MGEFVDTLPDRPFLLLLWIMGLSMLFLPFALLLRKGADIVARLLVPDLKSLGLDKVQAMVYADADKNGVRDGIPVNVKADTEEEENSRGYEAVFEYTVRNPEGVKLRLHRAGLMYRPLGFLPPEAEAAPAWVAGGGYVLRCSPPEASPMLASKVEPLRAFVETGKLDDLELAGGKLAVSLSSEKPWHDGQVKQLAAAGLAAAKKFN